MFSISFGTPGVPFPTRREFASAANARQILLGMVNHDAFPDLVTISNSPKNSITLSLHRGAVDSRPPWVGRSGRRGLRNRPFCRLPVLEIAVIASLGRAVRNVLAECSGIPRSLLLAPRSLGARTQVSGAVEKLRMALVQIPNDGNPIPIAPARLVGKEFVFRCPRRGCGESDLAERRFAFLEVVKCPDCAQPMRLAEVHQLQRYLKERAERANHIDGEVKRLQSEGATPPAALAIMGIASSGKTVYLSMLYHALRHGTGFMRGLADRGSAHDELIANFQKLENGSWFPATLTNLGFEVRVDVDERSVSLSILDFSGERFKELIYDQRTDASHHTEILNQIHESLGCLILIDPEQLAPFCERYDASAEFTAIKLIQMLAARRRAEHVVLVFTKQNANRTIVDDEGGAEEFLHKASNLLYQEVRRWKIPIFHVSAVSLTVEVQADGAFEVKPKPEPLRDHAEVMRPLAALVQRIHPTYFAWLEGDDEIDEGGNGEDDDEAGGEMEAGVGGPSDPPPPPPLRAGVSSSKRSRRHGRRRR